MEFQMLRVSGEPVSSTCMLSNDLKFNALMTSEMYEIAWHWVFHLMLYLQAPLVALLLFKVSFVMIIKFHSYYQMKLLMMGLPLYTRIACPRV